MRRLLYLALAALLVAAYSGCGNSDTLNLNSFNNNQVAGSLSGQTGTVTLQTQLAPINQTIENVAVIESVVIPVAVNGLRFSGFDENGALAYGPIEVGKSAVIDLVEVPVEVVQLRVELLVDGFTIGGLIVGVEVPSGGTFFVTNPTYVFLGSGSQITGDTVYGSFITEDQIGNLPDGDGFFDAAEAPILDFPTPQVTNGITRDEATRTYVVSEDGDYLLTYSVEIQGNVFTVLVSLIRNGVYVPNTETDIADLDGGQGGSPETALQQFQLIVSLSAGDRVNLGVRQFEGGEVPNQTVDPDLFQVLQGTFSILRLGDGGVTPQPPVEM